LSAAVDRTQSVPQSGAPLSQQSSSQQKDDVSGMYSFLREGEFVQITVEEGSVSGFVSRYGDAESDKGSFLDQFFSKASLVDNKLTFTTKPVHDVWFEFSGTVERGPGKVEKDEAFRILRGRLTQFATGADKKVSAKSRDVEFRSFPRDSDDDDK
jgi:hypothetical protein